MQTVEGSPFVVIGSAAKANNLFVVDTSGKSGAPAGSPQPPAPTNPLQVRSAFSAPQPIYHMSTMGKMLATAGPNSSVQLFNLDKNELGKRGKGLEHISECRFGAGKLEDLKLSPPGTRCASVRVHHVEFAPSSQNRASDPTKLLALEGRKVHIWDLTTQKVMASEVVSFDQLMSSSWSPHAPLGTIFATAGVDHHLYVMDSRLMGSNSQKAVVWKIDRAHGGQYHGAITALQFNPFIPYWLASTGSDDRSWRAWMLDARLTVPRVPAKDMFIGSIGTEWGDPAKKKAASGAPKASTSGEHYSQEYEIERALHGRDLTTAYNSVISMSRASLLADRTVGRTERAMIELCTARPPLDASAWSIATGSVNKFSGKPTAKSTEEEAQRLAQLDLEMIEKIRVELENVSYYLPPSFGLWEQWYATIPSQTKLEFEMVVLRFNILVDVLKGNWETIVKAEKMISKGMEMDPTFMEPDTLQLLIECVLPNDFTRGLSMGIRFAEVIEDLPNGSATFTQLTSLFHLLLFPTVYDHASWLVDPSNLEQSWSERGPMQRQIWVREFLDSRGVKPEPSPRASEGSRPSIAVSRDDAGAPSRPRGSVAVAAAAGDVGRSRSPSLTPGKLTATRPAGRMSVVSGPPNASVAFAPEVDEPTRRKTAIEAHLTGNAKEVMRMVKTELAVVKVLAKSVSGGNDAMSEGIIKIVTGEDVGDAHQERPVSAAGSTASLNAGVLKYQYRPTMSAATNRLYLDALLQTKRFEEYFQMGFDFISTHVESLYSLASSHLADAISIAGKAAAAAAGAPSQPTAVVGQTMTGGTKTLREGLALIAKVGTIMAQSMEGKGNLDKEGVEVVARCFAVLSGLLMSATQLGASMFKILETMERMLGKTGSAGAFARFVIMREAVCSTGFRDAASLTSEDIRQACRGFPRPTEGKTRAFSAALSAATGASVRDSAAGNTFMEETYAIVDRLKAITTKV
ncbi:hypothetical protein HK101_006978 [Irineochytrium annulatum]|nr:hypothetical protein HK101_006978 [Irineochytrium annulatum]